MAHVLIMAETVHRLQVVGWLVFGERRTLRASFTAGACGPPFQVRSAIAAVAVISAPGRRVHVPSSFHGAVALTLTVVLRPPPCWFVVTPVKPCARQRSANALACSAVHP